jgi:hypothetical protein
MADLVEPSSSNSGCVEVAPPCATTSSTLVSYSSAPSLRHLYPAIDDWPSPPAHHYPNHQHQFSHHHHHQHDYTPQRSPITDTLYSSTLSSSSSHPAPTWQSESWSNPQPPTPAPPRDQHTAAGCACCPAPLAVAVGVGSPYPPSMSWLSGGGW